MKAAAFALTFLATPLFGQVFNGETSPFQLTPEDNGVIRLTPSRDVTRETREPVAAAPAAMLRGLDKISGVAQDLSLETGESTSLGYLNITLHECRVPRDNPTGNAYARLTIQDRGTAVFDGWMVASSPALAALDHARFDIWVIRCKFDNRSPSVTAGESSPRPLMRP